jgi:K+-sensing histidine kinase KdpD
MKKLTAFITLLFVLAITPVLLADKHSKEEVSGLIKEVETLLDSSKSEGAETYAPKEISKVEDLLKEAKKQLDDNERDIAFFIISKAKAYFVLIGAKKELLDSEAELKSATELRKGAE